ncbi:hypothetical protein [Erythrobacter oryzae]|uniref:hypothetical protein n=1 Tax=Erythrobacter oryzae TaxID=3019556 RepID=UPI0025525A8C|nr:hypothetical protein [Erythrobacter sp. COR-2]
MVEDGIGEVIGDVAEGAIEALGDFSYSANSGRRRRRGCWRLFLIALVVALIVWGVAMLVG